MNLIYKFDNGYSCDIENSIIYDPDGHRAADISSIIINLQLDLRTMSDISVWALCCPIVTAHENGVKKGTKQMIKRIYEVFGIKEGDNNA